MPMRQAPATLTAAALGGLQTVALLRRLRTELTTAGRLSTPSVVWMDATYGAHAAATAVALTRRLGRLPLPRTVALAGGVAAVAGSGLAVAGMTRFGGGQLHGTQTGPLITSGVYQYSRNPQYTGGMLLVAGMALARRSGVALALAAGMAAAFGWWVPVEERHLERVFGDPYRRYLAQTPRWLGLPWCGRPGT